MSVVIGKRIVEMWYEYIKSGGGLAIALKTSFM